MFFETSGFPFVEELEASTAEIRAEFERLDPAKFTAWPEKFLYENRWDVFGLYAFGRRLSGNCGLCAGTTAAVERVPGMVTAGFSWLAAGTHIKPHRGYTDSVLRCHLPLIVPDGCALRVGGETRGWEEGRCMIFDDTVEHEAWNRGDSPRVILLLDFVKPGHRYAAGVTAEAAGAAARVGG